MRSIRLPAAWAALAIAAWGQSSTGSLYGEVRDPSRALIAGSQIQAVHLPTGFVRTTLSGGTGEFRLDDLQPGTYSVTVRKNGFCAAKLEPVAVEVKLKTRLDIELSVGNESDEITVTTEAALVQSADASEGHFLASATTSALPVASRNVLSLVTLGPGAIPRHMGGFLHDIVNDLQANRGANAFNSPVNGARPYMNANVLDGAYNMDGTTFAAIISPPFESIQEFRMLSSLAPAHSAQAGGGVIDTVTKSGSQQLHGSAFEYLRNEATDARGVFEDPSLPRPIYRQNQFGGSLGGPVGIRSTFFFGAYEGVRSRSATAKMHRVPGPEVRGGNFASGAAIFDPATLDTATNTRQPFPNNRIPANRIDPIATKFLSTYEPLPNQPESTRGNYLDATPSDGNNNSGSGRIDHQFRNQSWLFGRYTINDEQLRAAGFFPQLPTREELRAQQALLGYTVNGAGWVNQTRLAFSRLRVFNLPENAFQTNVIQELGMNGGPTDPFFFGLPFFVISNYRTVTDSPTLPQTQRNNTWQLSNGVSLQRGRHTIETGFQWIHFQLNYMQSQFPRGQYLYSGFFTADPARVNASGDPLADFELGFPQTTRRFAGNAQAYMRNNDVAGYLQDDIRISSRFLLNIGVRYEYISPYSEKRDHFLNLDYSTLPAPPALRPVNQPARPDRNNISPRIGFAWRLPLAVFRAGYGIYYQPELAVESYDLVRNGLRNEINQSNDLTPVLTTRDGFPQNASAGFPTYFGLDRDARTPYLQQWSGSFQRQLRADILIDVAYVGSKGTHLGRFRTFNTSQHVETGENLPPRPGNLQSLRTFPQLGPLYQRQHIANSNYHSLQVRAEKRFSRGLSFLASFVWAKSIDDADGPVPGQYDSWGAQDERNLRLERGLSFTDVRRRFSTGYTYRIPAPDFWRKFFDGWDTSGVITIQDGTPLNPVYFALDFANSGTPNRPNVVPGKNVRLPADERTIDSFFNRDAFANPQPFTFGTAGRNILPGPPNNVFDLALHRRFTLSEKHAVTLRVESFNALNHPNWGIPGPYPDFFPSFGKVFTAGQQRRWQFGLRYDF